MADIAAGSAKGKDEAFLSELLTGDFGADRLDYLLRDSYHLGVSYGKFDIQRLLNTFLLRYNEDEMGPELAIEDGGIHSVEGFLLARYFMFLDVYFHKTRRILDLHLTEFLRKLLPNGRYPEAVGEFLRWDDTKVLSLFACHAENPLFSRLFGRAHFRLAFETSDHPEKEEVERFDWLCAELERRYGSDALRFDEAQKAPYNYAKPLLSVLWRGKCVPIEKRSPLVRSLRRIQKMRVYAAPELRDEVSDFCEEFLRAREERRRG